jgi:hypothetical protein
MKEISIKMDSATILINDKEVRVHELRMAELAGLVGGGNYCHYPWFG